MPPAHLHLPGPEAEHPDSPDRDGERGQHRDEGAGGGGEHGDQELGHDLDHVRAEERGDGETDGPAPHVGTACAGGQGLPGHGQVRLV